MPLHCKAIWGAEGDEEDGPAINASLDAASLSDSFRHFSIFMSPDPGEPNRCYVDWGSHVDQSNGEWGYFADFEIAAHRRTLILKLGKAQGAPGDDHWVLECPSGIDADCEAVLQTMKAGSWRPIQEIMADCAEPVETGLVIAFSRRNDGLLLEFRDLFPTDADFFGHDHYVEIGGQAFGRFGGVKSLELGHGGHRLEVRLNYEAPDLGSAFAVVFRQPVGDREASLMNRLKPDRKTSDV